MVEKQIYINESRFHKIEVIESSDYGRMLFLNNDLQIAETDRESYNRAIVNPIVDCISNSEVLILGGGSGGVVNEVLKHNPRKITVVDIDDEVIYVSRKYLAGINKDVFANPKVKLINQEAVSYLRGTKNSELFDCVICSLTNQPEVNSNLNKVKYLHELFKQVYRVLRKGGEISLQGCSVEDKNKYNLLNNVISDLFFDIEFKKVHIPSYEEDWIFCNAKKY